MRRAKRSRLHLLGLVSDGGVHSMLSHLEALLEMAQRQGVSTVFVHAFTDGRDTSPTAGAGFLERLQAKLDELTFERGRIATVVGRYYAMDRDQRWERTERAFRLLRFAEGHPDDGPAEQAVRRAYQREQTDEFIEPIVLDERGTLDDGDVAVFFNFRPDRARQLTRAFIQQHFEGFDREGQPDAHWVGMTQYDRGVEFPVAYPPEDQLKNVLGEVLSLQKELIPGIILRTHATHRVPSRRRPSGAAARLTPHAAKPASASRESVIDCLSY